MTDAKFEKVSCTSKCLYGPRKLLLCGFEPAVQGKFDTLLEMLGFADLTRVWAASGQSDLRLEQLMGLDDGSGHGERSGLPRAVIMAGIAEEELHRLMNGARKAGMRDGLWATLTPVSERWQLKDLLAELAAEREAMRKRSK